METQSVFERFLRNTKEEAAALVDKTNLLRISPEPRDPPHRYLCELDVPYLRRLADGPVVPAEGPVLAGIQFPDEYLHSVDPHLYMHVVVMLTPDIVHPNISPPFVCLGSAFRPGTSITALVTELYEIVSYQNFCVEERNALNPEACRLFRNRPDLLQGLRPAPLFRRKRRLQIEVKAI